MKRQTLSWLNALLIKKYNFHLIKGKFREGGGRTIYATHIYNGVGHFEVAIYNGVGQFDFKLSHPVVDGHLKMSHPVVDCHAAVIVRPPPRVEVLVTPTPPPPPPPLYPWSALDFFFKIFFSFNFRLILTLLNLFTSLTQFLLSLIVCCEVCLFV